MTLKEKVFRNTIIYPAIFAVITLTVLVVYQVMNLTTISRENKSRNSIVQTNYSDARDRACSFAAMLASYDDIKQGTADDRRHYVTRVVDPIFENINASIVTVHEKDGFVIARGHNTDIFGDDESSVPYVIKAIEGGVTSQSITDIDGMPSLICTKPVYYNEQVSGAVTVGYFLDNAFAARLASLVGGQIIISRKGKVFASSFDHKTETEEYAEEEVAEPEEFPEMTADLKNLWHSDRNFDLSYVELQKDGKVETGLFIAVDNSRVRRILWGMMAGCIFAIVVVFVAMSRRLNRFCDDLVAPVVETAEHADSVAGGNLDIEPLGSAEVRELARLRESFNKMVGNLREMTDRDRNQREYLEGQVADLLTGIDAAAEGDFSTKFDAERDDAFGKIGSALNKMIEDLQKLMAQDHDRRVYLEQKISELLDIINAASKGDFSKEYKGAETDEIGRLGVALSNMISELKTLMDQNTSRREALEKQIAGLVTVIEAASEGDYSRRVDSGGQDEMSRVGHALNKMISELENRLEEIERMKKLDREKSKLLESQVREILEVVSRASDGDLTVQLHVYGEKQGETEIISRLKENLNSMFSHLAMLVSKVRESSQAVEQISREVSSYTARLSQGAESQAKTINRTAAFVDSMSDSMDIVTGHSDDVLKLSQQTNEEAAQGGETVSHTVYGIGQVGEAMEDIEMVMKELEASAGEIDAIVRVIDEISDQTNLLALNAAIEAARAGEYGRGFSVVAREVSILAQKSVESTREITLIVRRIQERMKNATTSTERGKKRVDEGAALADQAGKALEIIVSSIDNVTGLIKQTASSIRERQGETSEIRASMKEVLGISEESAALASKTSDAVENLARLSRELDLLVQQIRIDTPGDARR